MQGSGGSMGATYDSQQGLLVLDRAVELKSERGGETVVVHAQHAEFERGDMLCRLHVATADYRGGQATAGDAKILFRDDGSAVRLDAMNGFTLTTETGGHVAAPTGSMDFNEHNQPRHAHLEGGVTMDSASKNENHSRQVAWDFACGGTRIHAEGPVAPRAPGAGRGDGQRRAERAESGAGPVRVSRTWRSPVADVEFRDTGNGQMEPATIHGTGGVVVTGESQRGKGAVVPSRLSADEVTGEFGPGAALTAMTGVGHASIEETTATGTRQTTTGDRLEAHFATAGETKGGAKSGQGGATQVQSAVVDGHVVLTQMPAAKPGAQPQAPLRATAGRAVYESTGEWLHLTLSPRVENGGFQLTADKVDVSHDSGDAFAHGNVKATGCGYRWCPGRRAGKRRFRSGELLAGRVRRMWFLPRRNCTRRR